MILLHVGIGVLAVITGVSAMGQPDRLSAPPPPPPEAVFHQIDELAPGLEGVALPGQDAIPADLGPERDAATPWPFDDVAMSTSFRGRILVDLWREWPEARGVPT